MKMKPNPNLEKARQFFELKDYKKAEIQYLQIQKSAKSPAEQAIIWAELSWLYYKTQNYQKAIEAAENVLLNDEDYSTKDRLFRVQGYAYLGLKKNMMAIQYLKLSLEENSAKPEQQVVKYELGKLYFKSGDYDLALPYMEDVRNFFKNENQEYFLSVLFFLGFIYFYLESFAKAQQYFDEIISSNPSKQRYASALFGTAYIEFHNKNYLKVISLCEKIVSLDKNFFDKESVGFLTAASYYYLGRKDLFNAYYEQMIKSYPAGKHHDELERLRQNQTGN